MSLADALIPELPLSVATQLPRTGADVVMADGARTEQALEFTPKDDTEMDGEMEDLFGNDDGAEVTKEDGAISSVPSAEVSDSVSTQEREHRKALEYEEEAEPVNDLPPPKVEYLNLPNIPMPKSSDGNTWVIRMPNFVKVDPKPFHAETYMGPEHDDEESQHTASLRERSMTIKLKVENTVRWRWIKDENGRYRRQSNSRIIRWSDGSLSLMLGKELFDINQSIDTSGAVPRQAFGSQTTAASQPEPSLSQSQSQSQTSGMKSQGLTYLVAQHKRSQVLQAEALITGYMTLTPTGMQSETHRMLVRAVGQKHNKVARLRMAPDPTTDPEREKMELMKQNAKKSKKKADLDDGLGGGRRKRAGYSRKRTGHDVWSDDDEDGQPGFAVSDEEEDDGMGSAGGSSPRKGSRKAPEDEKKGPGEYQEDDFVVADSSDDEAGAEGQRKRKRRDGDEEMEEDPLDKLDAKIREQEDENKRRRERPSAKEGGDDVETEEGDDEEMEVESEEDEEEEFKVRHAGGAGGRKKRAIQFDEEDE